MTLIKVRTARKRHRCTTRSYGCASTVQPGERYAQWAMPPGGELGALGWWHGVVCAPCSVGRPYAEQVLGKTEKESKWTRIP